MWTRGSVKNQRGKRSISGPDCRRAERGSQEGNEYISGLPYAVNPSVSAKRPIVIYLPYSPDFPQLTAVITRLSTNRRVFKALSSLSSKKTRKNGILRASRARVDFSTHRVQFVYKMDAILAEHCSGASRDLGTPSENSDQILLAYAGGQVLGVPARSFEALRGQLHMSCYLLMAMKIRPRLASPLGAGENNGDWDILPRWSGFQNCLPDYCVLENVVSSSNELKPRS
ncbi:hypothetical protein C8F04DRAFT_1177283 [Mycena alexandri]|uniref:Uncharacterized protein n=1 Tax=Mycena alexandri TaxID=1745969 RepID=A0AAD6TBM0_9AGAR|nr:hypothetical protein C8F04DRAFT_1177283 [Mycena alexandri]